MSIFRTSKRLRPWLTPRHLRAAALALAACAAAACHDPNPGQAGGRVITNNVTDWRDEVIYQLLVDRFEDGDYSNNHNMDRKHLARYQGGDWQGIIDRIPYLKQLGVTTLWISPVVRNLEEDAGFAGYHGYWTQDFTRVNPHFGDLAKLQELVDTLHGEGFKVILDIVTNHIGQLFYYDMNMNGRPDDTMYGGGGQTDGSKNQDLPGRLTRISEWDPDYDRRGVQAFTSLGESGPSPIYWVHQADINRAPIQPAEFQNKQWYHRKGRVTAWEHFKAGNAAEVQKYCKSIPDNNVELCDYVRQQEVLGDFPGGLKDLATEIPDVQNALIKVFQYWISVGDFDGFRIDTLKHVDHPFWKAFCPAMRQHAKSLGKDKFLMFGEAFSGVDRLLGEYTKDQQVDSVFYFSQKYTLTSVFQGGAATKQLQDLHTRRLQYYETRAHTGGVGVPPHEALIGFLDNHDVERFLHAAVRPVSPIGWERAIGSLHAALSYLFTSVGIPNIYYGTEQQLHGGNDPANREVMWRGNPARGLKAFDTDNATFKHIQALIKVRKDLAPLRRGDYKIRWSTSHTGNESDTGIFAFERTYQGQSVLVVVNAAACSDTRKSSTTSYQGSQMQTGFSAGTVLVNAYPDTDTTDQFVVGSGGAVEVKVPCHGVKILAKKK